MSARSLPSKAVVAVGVFTVLGLVCAPGCNEKAQHVFGAYAFDADADCLERPAVIDVVSGKDPGPCDRLRCWISADLDVYVTDTACDAPLDFEDHTDDAEGPCFDALEVYEREEHGLCPDGTGGGSASS